MKQPNSRRFPPAIRSPSVTASNRTTEPPAGPVPPLGVEILWHAAGGAATNARRQAWRSGSMESCRDSTIDAFNEYVSSLASKEDLSARISLTLFDSEGIDLIEDAVKANAFPKLTREVFEPRAMTPLFDAIGKTVTHIDKADLRKQENVALVILTDGLENHSSEYDRDAVKALLEGRQKDKGWLVIYLGANQDAWKEGAAIGLHSGNVMDYDTANVGNTMAATARRSVAYAESGNATADSFTDEERRKATD
jgi:hypothetical protein